MPASVGGEWGRSAELLRCPRCGAPTSRGDRFCRSCGAGQATAPEPTGETEQLSGAAGEADLDPPTERATRAEPPTERRPPPEPRAPRMESPPPPAGRPRKSGRRRLIAVAAAVAIGLGAGLVAVIALDGADDRAPAPAAPDGERPAAALDPVETLGTHFDLLEQGRFLAASDDLTPELLASLGGRTIWVSGRIADLLIDAQLEASVAEETDSSATVQVDSLRTESLAGGCTDFSGTYSMVRSGDRWLIDSADLIDRPC
ncbi:MAG: zinc ribbon domain-containing protein [Solirubrobacterales bacterium]